MRSARGVGRMLVGGADEQFVLELVAQARKRMAHGGLAHPQPEPGARKILLLLDRIKDDQEIKVECVPGHGRPSVPSVVPQPRARLC